MESLLSKIAFLIGLLLIVFHSQILTMYHHWKGQLTEVIKPSSVSQEVLPQTVSQTGDEPTTTTTTSTPTLVNTVTTLKQVIPSPTATLEAPQREATQVPTQSPLITPSSQTQKNNGFDAYVESVFNGQKAFFKNCYVRHLKNNTEAKGSLLVSFHITSPGVVSEVNILGGSIQDTRFHKCTKDVVERISFRHFKGPPTKVFYPIEFF